jgi:hypothetical protein
MEAGTEREKDELGKNEHVCHWDDVEGFYIKARGRVGPGESFGCRQNAKDDHETGQEETRNAEAAVNVHAACGDQGSLRDEQEDPQGKNGAVNVNDPMGKGAWNTPAR